MSGATKEPAFSKPTVQPSKEAKRIQAHRRRGPVLVRRRKPASILRTSAALVGWITRVCDAPRQLAALSENDPRRYLQLARFIEFGCDVSRLDDRNDRQQLAGVWARHAGKLSDYVAFSQPPTPVEIVTYVPIAVAAIERLGVTLDTIFPE